MRGLRQWWSIVGNDCDPGAAGGDIAENEQRRRLGAGIGRKGAAT
jgi:hypothetical protein